MGSVLVPNTELQQAIQQDPAAVQETVYQSATDAAHGDQVERDRLIKKWHDAVASLEAAKNADQSDILSTPQHALASRLQTLLAQRSASQGQL